MRSRCARSSESVVEASGSLKRRSGISVGEDGYASIGDGGATAALRPSRHGSHYVRAARKSCKLGQDVVSQARGTTLAYSPRSTLAPNPVDESRTRGRMSTKQTLPVLPLRGTVIFPGITAPIAAGRPGTLRAIEAALKSDLTVHNWMSDATRKQAIVKLDAFLNKIGYPDKWRDYSALNVDRSSYQTNRLRVGKFNEDRDWAKVGKPVDRMEWGMTPPTVNAYYNPQNNEIVFPAGILQPPFFDPNADDALNYGSMGSVIGHEMTHGFDDQGSKYDPSGNLANWWSEADLKAFKERAGCIVNQFNNFEVEKGLNENGSLVQGESIADLGGLVVAYAAFQKAMEGKPRTNIDGFTPEQRFFLGYARGWATNMRPELARVLVLQDPHPLSKFRVNGPLSNMPQFAAAFQCKDGDAMVRPEKDRCVIW